MPSFIGSQAAANEWMGCLQTPDTESEQADNTCDEGKRDHTVNATAEDEQIQ
jgi:hypothetical protein